MIRPSAVVDTGRVSVFFVRDVRPQNVTPLGTSYVLVRPASTLDTIRRAHYKHVFLSDRSDLFLFVLSRRGSMMTLKKKYTMKINTMLLTMRRLATIYQVIIIDFFLIH